MIIDSLKNAACYCGCSPKINLILKYLEANAERLKGCEAGPQTLPEELQQAGISMKIVEFDTVEGTRKWESHVEHTFLYYMLEGEERCGYCDISLMGDGVRSEGKDQIVWHKGDGDRILFPKGHFTVIFPQDAHMSKLANGTSARAKKCSFKFRQSDKE